MLSRMARAVGAAVVLASGAAAACGVCFDHALKIQHPMFDSGLVAVLSLWILTAALLQVVVRVESARAVRVALSFVGAAGVALSGAALVWTGGSFMAVTVVASAAGFLFVVIQLVLLTVRHGWSRRMSVHAAVHGAFIALGAFTVAGAVAGANSPERLVRLLRYSVPDTSGVVVPKVVAGGAAMVRPLIEAEQQALKDGNLQQARYAAFCLERICGAEAEDSLRKMVREPPADLGQVEGWRFAVFAYGGCARGRAVDPLTQMLASNTANPVAEILLEALVRTATRQGVDAALREPEPLLETLRNKRAARESAWLTLQALSSGAGAAALAEVPLYRMGGHTLAANRPQRGYEAEFYWEDTPVIDADEFLAHWAADGKDVKARWDKVLE